MKKNKKYFNKCALPPFMVLLLLLVCNYTIGQQQTQLARSISFTNNACGNYPEKGNFLESASTLNAGGNGCITKITSGTDIVFFKGRDKIILGPGFHTETGAKFVAYIEADSAIQSLIQEQLVKTNSMTASSINFLPGKAPLNRVAISQNSPNPFRNSTVISYNVPRRFFASQIVVHDAVGKVCRQINIPPQGAGTINFEAAALTSGIYSYSLWVDGQLIETKKMILIK